MLNLDNAVSISSELFLQPPSDYYPIAFWSWNDRLNEKEILEQIDMMHQGKLGGVFLHSRVGLITPYMEEDWFQAVKAAIIRGKQKGLKVWLYDEDGYPSGFGGGTVPLKNQTHRMKMLLARPDSLKLPNNFRKIGEPAFGMQIYLYTAELDSEWFNGTCYIDTMHNRSVDCFIDTCYEPYYSRHGNEFGENINAAFTDEPCTIYRMNIPKGGVPFSENIFHEFRRLNGYDAQPKLYLLFLDLPGAVEFRLHYFRTVNFLFEHQFSRKLGSWCDRRGLDLTGHYMAEDTIYDQQLWGFKTMPNYRHLGIPGIDMLGKDISFKLAAKQCQSVVNQYGKKRMLCELFGVTGSWLSFEDRLWLASSQICLGVNLFVPHLYLYSMAGCRKRDFPPNLFYQQPWWELNELVHTPLARMSYALSQGRYLADVLIVHPQESSFVLWQTKWQLPDVSYAEYDVDTEPIEQKNKKQIDELDCSISEVIDHLLEWHCQFDFGDETIMAQDAKVVLQNGTAKINIGEMNYAVAVLPAMETISRSTFELLKDFQACGGVIISCGKQPSYLDGVRSEQLDLWLNTIKRTSVNALTQTVFNYVKPPLKIASSTPDNPKMFWSHIRDLGNGDILAYVSNLHRKQHVTTTLQFNGPWQSVYLLDKLTGAKEFVESRKDLEREHLTFDAEFSPAEDRLFLLSDAKVDCSGITLVSENPKRVVEIDESQLQIEALDDNALILDYAHWQIGQKEFSAKPIPIIAIQQWLDAVKYAGPVSLKYPVKLKNLQSWRKVHLIVEHPERYQILVNGQIVRYAGLPFWKDIRWLPIDVSGMLVNNTENIIELRCSDFMFGDKKAYDKFSRYGTEIEPVYLAGDFGVYGELLNEHPISPLLEKWGLPENAVWSFKANSFQISNPQPLCFGDAVVQGLPFYAGVLKYTLNVDTELVANANRVELRVGKMDGAIASVQNDNDTVGHIFNQYSRVDVTKLRAGHQLSIKLYGTLNNLLGPHHHADGVLTQVSPFHCCPTFAQPDPKSDLLKWMSGQKQPLDWRERYVFLGFGDLSKIYFNIY